MTLVNTPGVPAQPTKGTKRVRYPDVRYRATFYTQGDITTYTLPQTIQAEASEKESATGRASSDIISCSTQKSLENPVGTWRLTLVPRQDYLTQIVPGDWCEIEGDNGDGLGWRVLCYGPIKSIDLNRSVSERGITRSMVQMSGTDFGETLVKTSPLYDPALVGVSATQGVTLGNILPSVTGSPGEVVKAILKHYFQSASRQLLDPRAQKPFFTSIDLGYIDEDGTLGQVGKTEMNPGTSLWQLLQMWANEGVNEFFVDYRPPMTKPDDLINLVPSIVLRQYPFWGQAWQALPMVRIDSDEVSDMTMGRSDGDVRNWIRPMDEMNTGLHLTANMGTINRSSIDRFGFRRFESPTVYSYPGKSPPRGSPARSIAGGIVGILKAHAALQTLWHHSNERLYNASITLCFRPEIRVGYKISYRDLDTSKVFEFYVESVSHNLGYPNASTTQVTLTRGRDAADQFWKKDITALKASGVIEELGNTITDSMALDVKGLIR